MNIISKLKRKTYLILRASEKYTKTDMIYLTKGGFWLTTNHIVSFITSFILSITMAYFLTKNDYGNYQYILSLGGILVAFSLSDMGTAVVQSVARGFEGTLKQIFLIKLKWDFIIILIISFIIGIYYFINHNYIFSFIIILIGIALPVSNSAQLYSSFLVGKKYFKANASYDIIKNLIYFILIFITLITTKNIILLVLIQFISISLITIFLYKHIIRKYHPNNKININAKNYGIHLSLLNFLSNIASYADRLLIFHYFGPVELAIYSFAVDVPNQIRYLLRYFNQLALPKFSTRSIDELKDSLNRRIIISSIIIFIIIIIYILISPFVYKLFFPQYFDSIKYSQLYSLSLIGFIPNISTAILKAHSAVKQIYLYTISIPIIYLLLLLLFINLYGVLGVIIAIILNKFIGIIFSYVLVKKMT